MTEIDLHTHSTASDGSFTPAELVAEAVRLHLKALALTDHDTILGLPEARAAGQRLGLELIGGCELSVSCDHGSMHLLGLWIPEEPSVLGPALTRLAELRIARNKAIIHNLNRHGIDLTYAELEEAAGGGSVGRPHIAEMLVRKNVVRSLNEAFHSWLRPGTKGYAPKEKLAPGQAMELLRAERATIVLAHPCTLNLDGNALESLLRNLKDQGLDGVEVHYSMHTQAQTNLYAHLCHKLDLLPSAGSDFHGAYKPNIALGRGKGGLRTSYDLVRRMKERRAALGQSVPD